MRGLSGARASLEIVGSASAPSPSIQQVAYEASTRELDSQEDQLAGLHTRASFLLAAAGIATGTVLGRASGSVNAFGLLAVLAFGATALLATAIIAPRRNHWKFTASAQLILDSARDPEDLLAWLASKQHAAYTQNRTRLEDLYALLTYGCISLVIAICLSVVSLGM